MRTLQQICGLPIPGSVQGQIAQNSKKPGPVKGVPVHSKGVELDALEGPFQPEPFYASVIPWLFVAHTENKSHF